MSSYLDVVVTGNKECGVINKKQVGKKNLYSAEYMGVKVYLSYKTVIAEKVGETWNFTDTKCSRTTTEHLNIVRKLLATNSFYPYYVGD